MVKNKFLDTLMGAGATYLKHARFVSKALDLDPSMQYTILTEYVQQLSELSFVGFKMVLLKQANRETSSERKQALHSLLRDAVTAREGAPKGEQFDKATTGQLDETTSSAAREDLTTELEMLQFWFEVEDEGQRIELLIDYLVDLQPPLYSEFLERLNSYKSIKVELLNDHVANERKAWGPYIEDQMAYMQARERTGEQDPTWKRTRDELERYVDYFEWLIASSEGAWKIISTRK